MTKRDGASAARANRRLRHGLMRGCCLLGALGLMMAGCDGDSNGTPGPDTGGSTGPSKTGGAGGATLPLGTGGTAGSAGSGGTTGSGGSSLKADGGGADRADSAASSTLGSSCSSDCDGTFCQSGGSAATATCGSSSGLSMPCIGTATGMYCTQKCASDADCASGRRTMKCLSTCTKYGNVAGLCWSQSDFDFMVARVCGSPPKDAAPDVTADAARDARDAAPDSALDVAPDVAPDPLDSGPLDTGIDTSESEANPENPR